MRSSLSVPLLVILIHGAALSGVACNSQNPAPADPAAGQAGQAPPAPSIIYADGWLEIQMIANYAKTSVDHVAHFLTSRNACGKDAYGSLELGLWNQLATAMNAAIARDPLKAADEYCLPWPDNRNKIMDGTADVVLRDGNKRSLFEARGDGICTSIADRGAAEKLLGALNQIVLIADTEECQQPSW